MEIVKNQILSYKLYYKKYISPIQNNWFDIIASSILSFAIL